MKQIAWLSITGSYLPLKPLEINWTLDYQIDFFDNIIQKSLLALTER